MSADTKAFFKDIVVFTVLAGSVALLMVIAAWR